MCRLGVVNLLPVDMINEHKGARLPGSSPLCGGGKASRFNRSSSITWMREICLFKAKGKMVWAVRGGSKEVPGYGCL
jgi:hypothetical protein